MIIEGEKMSEETQECDTTSLQSRIWPLLSLVFFIGFTYLQLVGYVIPGLAVIFELQPSETTLHHIGLIWVPIIGYLLLAVNVCLTVRIFKPLDDWHEIGIIGAVVLTLSAGVVGGLTVGIAAMLSIGLGWEIITTICWGLIDLYLYFLLHLSPVL